MGAPKNFYNTVDQAKLGIDKIADIAGEVSNIKTTIGDENSGLTKRIIDLETTVGDEDSGLVKEVNDIVRLPEVTSLDKGKVLSVDDSGAWVAANTTLDIEAQIIVMQKTLDNLLNPPTQKLHEWVIDDNSSSLVDTIDNTTTLTNSGTLTTDGAKIGNRNQAISTPELLTIGRTAVIDLHSSNFNGYIQNNVAISILKHSGWEQAMLAWNSTNSKWVIAKGASGIYITDIVKTLDRLPSNPNLLSGGSVQITVIDKDTFDLYVNGQFIDTIKITNMFQYARGIGVGFYGGDVSFYDITCKKITIYGT